MTAEAAQRTRAVLSAGSNVGDRDAHLRSVIDAVAGELVAVSQVYATAPWGGVEQDDFHNITLIVEGMRSAADWLAVGAGLERAAGRTRDVRWGPRTLDVDVISVERDGATVISDDPRLTLPHPRAAERAFVLLPWLEIDPEARLWTPDGMRGVADLAGALTAADRDGVRAVGRIGQTASLEPTSMETP